MINVGDDAEVANVRLIHAAIVEEQSGEYPGTVRSGLDEAARIGILRAPRSIREGSLPRTPSATKALRVSGRRYLRNRIIRSSLRTYVKKARTVVDHGDAEEAGPLVKLAVSQLDKAASKGIIHRNQAARRKSRLMRQLAAAGSPRVAAATPVAAPTRARARTATKGATKAATAAAPASRPRVTTTRTRAASAPAATPEAAPAPTRTRRAASATTGESAPAPAPRTRQPRQPRTPQE